MTNILKLIGAAYGMGAGHFGCHEGPLVIYDDPKLFKGASIQLDWVAMIEPKERKQKLEGLPFIADCCERIAAQTNTLVKQKQRFATIGGDHSCAIGTWSGVAHALRDQGDLGLLWIDAHMDSHTTETSDSGNVHGMPVAALLGYGDAQLIHILDEQPKLKPENICLIGIRCFEAAEKNLLDRLGVRIYYAEEVQARGIASVLQEALAQVSRNTAGIGISVDLDGLDPEHAPAVGTPVENGICGEAFLEILPEVRKHPKFLGFEIAEFNPRLDINERTKQMVQSIVTTLAV